MSSLHLAYALVGGLAVVLAAISSRMRDLPLSEPLLALLLGVVVGPQLLGLLDLSASQRPVLLEEGTRLLLAVSLMGVALRYPVRRLLPIVPTTAVLVVLGMLAMAATTAVLARLVLGVPLALAALLGACVAPTDPVLASSVVTGTPAERDLPARTRQLLSMESGANDGLALPLVLLGTAVVLGHSTGRSALDGLYQVAVGLVVGVVVGLLAGRAVSVALRRDDVDPGASLVFTIVLAVAALGIARLLEADGILAVFVTGLAYNAAVAQDEVGPQHTIDEGVNRFLVLPVFVLLGVELPWAAWADLGAAGVALVVTVLLLRRLPVLLLLARPLGLRLRDAVFLGWFGPIGVSALFYLVFSHSEGVTDPRLWAAGTLLVTASTVVHGVSSAPGRRAYSRAAARNRTPHSGDGRATGA